MDKYIDDVLKQFYQQARAQFGDAIKAYWFNQEDACPGCGGEVDALKFKGKDTLSLNAFIYRERGVLIGYFLCGNCAEKIMQGAKKNPYKQTKLHEEIEKNLVASYQRYLRSLDA